MGGKGLKQIKELIREINNGENLNENIPIYTKKLIEVYQKSALLGLTFNYDTLYEIILEEDKKNVEKIKDSLNKINEVICKVFVEGNRTLDSMETYLLTLKQIREDNTSKMHVLTAIADKIQNYEYVLNRIELKYQDNIIVSDEMEFVKKVLNYIFSIKDNVVINENIKEVIGQLPIRMARTYYFQLIKNSLSAYIGGDKSSVESFLYMIETSAMLYETEKGKEYFPEAFSFIGEMEEINFSKLEECDYLRIVEKLEKQAKNILELSDIYLEIQGIVNSLYAFILTLKYHEEIKGKEMDACKYIIGRVYQQFRSEKWNDISEELVEQLVKTEGLQEEFYEVATKYEAILYKVRIDNCLVVDELKQTKKLETLSMIQKLLSTSKFIELETCEIEEVADDIYVEEKTKDLLDRLLIQFKQNQMCLNRAVIANTISKFPVFFSSAEEVKEYIENALQSCQDIAEKQACINIIEDIIEEADNFFRNKK